MDWNSLLNEDPYKNIARISFGFALRKNLQKERLLDSFSLSPF
jgi:hypothetical protein